MRTDRIGVYDKTSFGMLNIKRCEGITDKVVEAIEASPAMKKFGKRYNADVYYQEFSELGSDKVYKGLVIDNVEPRNIVYKVMDILDGIMPEFGNFLHYNSYRTTEAEFAEAIKGLGKNEIINRYHP